MLRFINPAIVTPQAYMLVDGNPAKNPRRTLTLVAKLLQNLANKPSYSKENYMMALNSFVETNKLRFNKFLNELCEVGDFYEALEVRKSCFSSFFKFNHIFTLDGSIRCLVKKGNTTEYYS